MCRLFGFRSQVPSPVHRSLVREKNALVVQSHEHPDGWGIGWWTDGQKAPELVRGAGPAWEEEAFTRHAEMVSAAAVIAHIRKASVGPVRLENAHPFRWGRWLFAHNGTVTDFDRHRSQIEGAIAPDFHPVVVGETDTARCFGIFLSHLARLGDPSEAMPLDKVAQALAQTVTTIAAITDPGAEEPSATTFLVGDGSQMLAYRRGRTLFFSTNKSRCPERESCAHHRPHCETPVDADEPVNHLIVASERTSLEDEWREVPVDSVVGVDEEMRLHRWTLGDLLPGRSGKVTAA